MTSVCKKLLMATVLCFVAQSVLSFIGFQNVNFLFGLSLPGLMKGYVWQVVTYIFLHGGPIHLLFNMMALYFLGPEIERWLGSRNFLALYLLSGVLGGLGWLLIQYPMDGYCIGASGSVFGLMGAAAALFPQRLMTLLIFGVFPLTLETWKLAVGMAAIELYLTVTHHGGGIANAAHLAGGLVGYVLVKTWYSSGGSRVNWNTFIQEIRDRKSERGRREVDRILDKAAREGFHTLTAGERDTLQRASRSRTTG